LPLKNGENSFAAGHRAGFLFCEVMVMSGNMAVV
jgi:hypothetical protein